MKITYEKFEVSQRQTGDFRCSFCKRTIGIDKTIHFYEKDERLDKQHENEIFEICFCSPCFKDVQEAILKGKVSVKGKRKEEVEKITYNEFLKIIELVVLVAPEKDHKLPYLSLIDLDKLEDLYAKCSAYMNNLFGLLKEETKKKIKFIPNSMCSQREEAEEEEEDDELRCPVCYSSVKGCTTTIDGDEIFRCEECGLEFVG